MDASIHQVISGEKLNGDTINFCFHYLRQNYATSAVNTVGFGSTYFYPSLEHGDDAYRKYIGKKSLWEYQNVMIPVHLPPRRALVSSCYQHHQLLSLCLRFC